MAATASIAASVATSGTLLAQTSSQQHLADQRGTSAHITSAHIASRPANTQTANTTPAGWNLRWRKSSQVTPKPVHVPQQDVFARPARDTVSQPASPSMTRPASQPRIVATQHIQQPSATSRQTAQATTLAPRHVPVNAFRMAAVERRALERRSLRQQAQTPGAVVTAFVPSATHTSAAQTSAAQTSAAHPHSGVEQASYVQRTGHNELVADNTAGGVNGRVSRANDFFSNPFADPPSLQKAGPAASAPTGRANEQQLVQDSGGFSFPGGDGAAPKAPESLSAPNELRGGEVESLFNQLPPGNPAPQDAPPLDLPTPPSDSTPVPQPELSNEPSAEPGLRELMKDAGDLKAPQPSDEQLDPLPQTDAADSDMPESPSDQDSYGDDSLEGDDDNGFQNPFPGARRDKDRDADDPNPSGGKTDPWGSNRKRAANRLTCEEFRERVSRKKIDTFTLDISPPFRPDLFDPKDYERERASFERKQSVRQWRGRDGEIVATGRLVDLAYEQVVLETESGAEQKLQISRLGEGDLGYLSENWQLPRECLIEQVAYQPRSWSPITMTWMAPNLCHKSNYYEEVNLERYGHTLGPWLQPVVSSAHFFANIAVTPYKMGIHPPTECRYALGYYRPGNCAPWIVPPVPISARGALTQGAFMTGAFWLIP